MNVENMKRIILEALNREKKLINKSQGENNEQ